MFSVANHGSINAADHFIGDHIGVLRVEQIQKMMGNRFLSGPLNHITYPEIDCILIKTTKQITDHYSTDLVSIRVP